MSLQGSGVLRGRTIAVCVSGGIAAYKACELVSALKKLGADVFVVMTQNACEFVMPLTFETLSNNRVIVDMFDKNRGFDVEHISLAKKADLFVIAPCTANVVAKLSSGIADDFLTTTVMASTKPLLIAPAMNTNMLNSPAYISAENTLKQRGVHFVSSDSGLLACGDVGAGRLAPVNTILDEITKLLLPNPDFLGKRVVVTAGSTREYIDPVRYITNRSSGKMGMAIAQAAAKRGAEVVLISGFVTEKYSPLYDVIKVETTAQMHEKVMASMDADYIIMAAAPADYHAEVSKQKIKADELSLKLCKNPDTAATVGQLLFIGKNPKRTKLIIFAAETENLVENARKKMTKKFADMVVANDVTKQGAGFDVDTNIVTIITKTDTKPLEIATKQALADIILDNALCLQK